MMEKSVLIGGSGGQGVMLLGFMIANCAIKENKRTSCMPSYGPEMRGGTANCTVIISEDKITTPIVSKTTAMILMNQLSYEKFRNIGKENCIVILNSSLIIDRKQRDRLIEFAIPCNEISTKLGDIRTANMVALGAYIQKTGTINITSALDELEVYFGKKGKAIELNKKAIIAGYEYTQEL